MKLGIMTSLMHYEISKYFEYNILKEIEEIVHNFINEHKLNKKDIILISNGYPWINHLPITLYLNDNEYGGIELYTPSDINHKTKTFVNTHEGRFLTDIHLKYKNISNIDTLNDFTNLIYPKKNNQKIIIKRGYKQSNTNMVRNCDYILYFGLDDINMENDILWNKIKCDKKYYNISGLLTKN